MVANCLLYRLFLASSRLSPFPSKCNNFIEKHVLLPCKIIMLKCEKYVWWYQRNHHKKSEFSNDLYHTLNFSRLHGILLTSVTTWESMPGVFKFLCYVSIENTSTIYLHLKTRYIRWSKACMRWHVFFNVVVIIQWERVRDDLRPKKQHKNK